jgi:hypothetical protein
MSTETISQFIEVNLRKVKDKHNIPESIIPEIIHLIEKYPNLEAHGSKVGLKRDLATIIENLRLQGVFR